MPTVIQRRSVGSPVLPSVEIRMPSMHWENYTCWESRCRRIMMPLSVG